MIHRIKYFFTKHYFIIIYYTLNFFHRKPNPSESADDEVVRETEETAVSDSSAVKDADTKVCEPSIQGDQEQVDSSTTEPLLSEVKEEGKEKTKTEDAPEEEKKEENSESTTATTENTTSSKKKAAPRKRSNAGKVSSGKSSRNSK